MTCVALFDTATHLVFEWAPFFTLGAVVAAPATAPWWTVVGVAASVVVGLLAILVALFKEEIWHRLHRAQLHVQLVDVGIIPGAELELRVKNTSNRTAAEEATVRVIELEPHPLEAAIGPRGVSHIVSVDTLLPRASGETTYGVAPQAEVRLPLLTLVDGWSEADPVVAHVPWAPSTTVAGVHEGDGLLILPSAEDRQQWSEMHPDLAQIMDSPALIRLEIAAKNVPAKLYTVMLRRTLEAPVGRDLPIPPGLRAMVFTTELIDGSAPHNRTMPAGDLPLRQTLAEQTAEFEAEERASGDVR